MYNKMNQHHSEDLAANRRNTEDIIDSQESNTTNIINNNNANTDNLQMVMINPVWIIAMLS